MFSINNGYLDVYMHLEWCDNGMFYIYSDWETNAAQKSNVKTRGTNIGVNAAACNPIYGRSSKVTPESYACKWFIKYV